MQKTIFSDEHRQIVEKLRKAREELKIDQKTAGKLLKKTQSYISKIESGQRRIDIVQLKNFSKIYKKDLNYFLK